MPVIVLLFSIAFHFLPQSTFEVTGGVRDQSGRSVTGVRLSVTDENFQPIYTSFVDSSGRYTIKGLRQGKFTFRIETTGTPYEEQSQMLELQSIRRLGGNETYLLDFVLKLKRSRDAPANGGSVFAQDVPKAARTEYERGVNNLKGNKTDLGVASLKKAVEIFPDYFDALELLGTEYVRGGQYESALPVLMRAVEINKRSSKSHYALGVAYLKLNRLAEAVELLEKAAQLEPGGANIQMMLGLAYGSNRAFDKSETAFKKALQLGGPAAAEAHYYLAGLYNKQDKYHEAWQELELYLKEAKSVKDPPQIKAMIAKLKEREVAKPALSNAPAAPSSLALPDGVQALPVGKSAGAATAEESNSTSGPTEPAATSAPVKNKPPEPVPPLSAEMVALLGKSEEMGGAMHRHLLNYTYQLKKTRRILNEHGKPIHDLQQVFEAYPVRGEHVLILLTRDGIPSKTLSDDRKRAVKELEEAERDRKKQHNGINAQPEIEGYVSAGVSGIYGGRNGYVSINVSEFIRSCDFFSPRVETVSGRPTVMMSFRPRAGAKLTPNHAYIARLVGLVWIDQTDGIVTRLEGWPDTDGTFDLVQSTAPRDEAALIYQQSRQTNGYWFPTLIRMNAGGRDLFDGLNWDVVFQFSNYQQFNTSADDVKIRAPERNP